MVNTVEIKSITIIHTCGADEIFLKLNLPEGCYPFEGDALAKMQVASDTAEEYCRKHFPAFTPRVIK